MQIACLAQQNIANPAQHVKANCSLSKITKAIQESLLSKLKAILRRPVILPDQVTRGSRQPWLQSLPQRPARPQALGPPNSQHQEQRRNRNRPRAPKHPEPQRVSRRKAADCFESIGNLHRHWSPCMLLKMLTILIGSCSTSIRTSNYKILAGTDRLVRSRRDLENLHFMQIHSFER